MPSAGSKEAKRRLEAKQRKAGILPPEIVPAEGEGGSDEAWKLEQGGRSRNSQDGRWVQDPEQVTGWSNGRWYGPVTEERQASLAEWAKKRDEAAAEHRIDPELLEVKNLEAVCVLCSGVMARPASGCPEEHSCCWACWVKELRERKMCPTCNHPVKNWSKLVRNRELQSRIELLRIRCQHSELGKAIEAAGAGPVRAALPAAHNPAGAPPPPPPPIEPGSAPSAAKRAKTAASPVETLTQELQRRGLDSTGSHPELEARVEEDRKKDASGASAMMRGCVWRGGVGELAKHLGQCGWGVVTCPHEGCAETMLRMHLKEHKAKTCEERLLKCRHCDTKVMSRLLAEHQGRCPEAWGKCPNALCTVQCALGSMSYHRQICPQEEAACPCPGCDARILRKDMDAHVVSSHLHSAAQQLQSLWGEIAGLKAMAGSEQRLSAAAAVAAEGAQRLAKATEDKAAEEEKVKAERIAGGGKGEGLVPAVVPAVIPAVEEPAGEVMVGEAQSKKDLAVAAEAAEAAAAAVQVAWVFNWRAGGWWAPGRFESETHDFGNGVTGTLALQAVHIHGGIPDRASRAGGLPEHSHQVGYGIQGIDKCKVHVAISLLDKDDAILRQIFEDGSVTAPVEHDFKSYEAWGEFFTPTAEEKVQSVRADGSIRLRAFVSLFLDGAA